MADPFKKKTVLVVDDDDTFLNIVRTALERAGYGVLVASNGKIAQHLIGFEAIDAVVSDIRMPEMTGIELTHFIKRTKRVPVILMTGFSELKETKEAYEIGAADFIAKPFKREDLLAILKKHVGEAGAEKPAAPTEHDHTFCKLNIEEFVSGKLIRYDIYVRLSESKYAKIAHNGEDLSVERIRTYKGKGLKYLYLKKEDFHKYVGFNLKLAPVVSASDIISREKKISFMKHTGEILLDQIHIEGVDEEKFESASTIVETTVSLLTEDEDTFNLLIALNSHTDYLYAHSLGVSLYGTMLAKAMRWSSATNQFKVAIGGVFHDIGKKEIDRRILNKARKDMDSEERRIFESHPTRGVEVLSAILTIPGDVLQIVKQHHENCMGLGYPSGLPKEKIHPMAKVVSVANEFCNLAIKNPNSPGLGPHEAIERMEFLNADALDPECFSAFKAMFSK